MKVASIVLSDLLYRDFFNIRVYYTKYNKIYINIIKLIRYSITIIIHAFYNRIHII